MQMICPNQNIAIKQCEVQNLLWFQTDQRPAASAPARCLPLDETTDDGAVAHTTKPGSKTKKAAFMTAKIGLERHLRQAVRALIPAHIA